MKNSIVIIAAALFSPFLMAESCDRKQNCEGVICTMMFSAVTAQVTNQNGQSITLDEVYTIRTKTGEKIKLEQHMGEGRYSVLDDSYVKTLANMSETFQFIGMKDSREVVNEPYIISADCCHVKKESGKETIVVQ